MNKVRLLFCSLLAVAFCAAVPAAFAAGPPVDEAGRWALPENARPTDSGETVYRCGTDERGPGLRFTQEQIDRWLSENKISAGGVIPVYVHVIRTSSEGNVSDADIAQQILVLNRHYGGRNYAGAVVSGAANTGYTFQLAGTDRTTSSKWFRMTPGSKAERDAKTALAISPASALNLYTCKPGQNLLGWAVFPWDSRAGGNQDGVVIHFGSLPNGYLSPYNLGGTASHEVGHYLGLYHTFQGGCDTGSCTTTGDNVCDTPAESSPTSGCPTNKDTCPAPGADPVRNYMDYSTDVCYDNFTAGQDTRMNMIVTASGSKRGWIGATRLAFDDGNRISTPDGEALRCATDRPRGRPVDVPDMATVERWIQENRIAAGGVIPVNFHVIHTSSEGNLTDAQLDAQIAVLNNNFAGEDYNGNPVPGAKNTGYTFFRASVTRNNSRKWFKMTPGSAAETQAKNALAVNWTSSLNLYTCKPGQNLLGWATFPVDLAANGKRDGVVIHYGSLPGGYLSPYNLGGTATHEVGHWVGLYHTFQGGCHSDATCSTQGDLVCDTPAEGTATSGCPGGKDTCSGSGLDPIHNYMDYSTDICYDNFTTGQDARADVQMSTYRPLIGSARLANGAGAIQSARDLDGGLVEFGAKPNPFNPRTKIDFGMREAGRASIRIYDVRGRLVRTLVDREFTAGNHSVDFDAHGMASGIYLMALSVRGEDTMVRRITLMK